MSLFHYSIKETAIGYYHTHLLMVSNLYHAGTRLETQQSSFMALQG